MFNYVKSELYRLRQLKSTYVLCLVFLIVPLVPIVLSWWFARSDQHFVYDNAQFMYMFASHALNPLAIGIIIITMTIFSNEFAQGTFKNSVAYGMKRLDLYFGKLLTTVIITLIYAAIILASFVLAVETLMKNPSQALLSEFLSHVLGSIPLFLIEIVVAVALAFIIGREGATYLGFFIVITGFNPLLTFFNRFFEVPQFLFKLLPDEIIAKLDWQTPAAIGYNWLLLLGYFILMSVLTIYMFNKRDL